VLPRKSILEIGMLVAGIANGIAGGYIAALACRLAYELP
jgi:hypothetical protein